MAKKAGPKASPKTRRLVTRASATPVRGGVTQMVRNKPRDKGPGGG